MEAMKKRHEEGSLERRAIDRETEDLRTQHVVDRRVAGETNEGLEKEIEMLKEAVANGNASIKSLHSMINLTKAHNEKEGAAQDVTYDEKRRHKQKFQFKESKLCSKKVNIEKKCCPEAVMKLQLTELDEQVEACKLENAEVKKSYEEERNRLGNITSKLEFQAKTLAKKKADREAEHKKLTAEYEKMKNEAKGRKYNKDLLIERLTFDTARCEKSIPKIEADIIHLETIAK